MEFSWTFIVLGVLIGGVVVVVGRHGSTGDRPAIDPAVYDPMTKPMGDRGVSSS